MLAKRRYIRTVRNIPRLRSRLPKHTTLLLEPRLQPMHPKLPSGRSDRHQRRHLRDEHLRQRKHREELLIRILAHRQTRQRTTSALRTTPMRRVRHRRMVVGRILPSHMHARRQPLRMRPTQILMQRRHVRRRRKRNIRLFLVVPVRM
jgi:hypothetical protein